MSSNVIDPTQTIDAGASPSTSPSPRKRRSVWRIIDITVWTVAIIGSVAFALGVQFGGLQITRVLSPSMVPTFAPGDLAVIRTVDAQDLQVGDIPMLPDPDEPSFQYVHRIINISKTPERGEVFVVTQGDANPASDTPVTIVTPKVPVVAFTVPTGWLNLANVTWNWSLWLFGGALGVFLLLLLLPSRKPEATESTDSADES